MSVNAIRELTSVELNEVAGGLDPVSLVVGGAIVAVGLGICLAVDTGVLDSNSVTKSIPVGEWLGRPA